jgi:hypothetical protein
MPLFAFVSAITALLQARQMQPLSFQPPPFASCCTTHSPLPVLITAQRNCDHQLVGVGAEDDDAAAME